MQMKDLENNLIDYTIIGALLVGVIGIGIYLEITDALGKLKDKLLNNREAEDQESKLECQ